MQEFKESSFGFLDDRGGSLVLESMSFYRCTFAGCALGKTTDISKRATVRNMEIIECRTFGGSVGPAIVENINIRDLKTSSLVIIWGAVFSHVTLAGEIGELKINRSVDVNPPDNIQAPFANHRLAYYSSVDWALDISQARFKSFGFRGIPARLVRRDPESQVVVTREKAVRREWRQAISSSNRLWLSSINELISSGDSDIVLVAPLGAPKEKRDELIAGLNELRSSGVAEPD